MKILLVILALFLTLAISAQQTDSAKIKASDPTQIYTFVEGYGGLNFLKGFYEKSYQLDSWEAGFRGNWGIKKFRIGVYLPASNNSAINRVFDDITIDLGYQVHNNSGLYNSTLINAGFTSPSHSNQYSPIHYSHIYPNSSSFNKFYLNYLGALKFTEKLAFYPGLEWFQRSDVSQPSVRLGDSVYYVPAIYSRGWKFSGTVSYDFNEKNFLQFNATWSFENWEGKYGSSDELNEEYSGFYERRLSLKLRYQYAFTPFAQAYFNVLYSEYIIDHKTGDTFYIEPKLFNLQLGFIYFLH